MAKAAVPPFDVPRASASVTVLAGALLQNLSGTGWEVKQTKLAPVRVVGKGRRISIGAGEFSPIVGVKAVR